MCIIKSTCRDIDLAKNLLKISYDLSSLHFVD